MYGSWSEVLYYYKVSTGGQQSAGAAPFFAVFSMLKTTKEPSEKALSVLWVISPDRDPVLRSQVHAVTLFDIIEIQKIIVVLQRDIGAVGFDRVLISV